MELCERVVALISSINEWQWEQRLFLTLLLVHLNWILLTVVATRIKEFVDLHNRIDQMAICIDEFLACMTCLKSCVCGVTWRKEWFNEME